MKHFQPTNPGDRYIYIYIFFFCSLGDFPVNRIWVNKDIPRDSVTFLPPSWRSLNPWKGHLSIPKRSQNVTKELTGSLKSPTPVFSIAIFSNPPSFSRDIPNTPMLGQSCSHSEEKRLSFLLNDHFFVFEFQENTSARAFSHQWTDLTSTQWHTDFTDLTSMEQISPHPNGTPQETKSDLANDAISISTMPLRFAIPEYKTVSCLRCISRSSSQWHTSLINLRNTDMNSKQPSWICEG